MSTFPFGNLFDDDGGNLIAIRLIKLVRFAKITKLLRIIKLKMLLQKFYDYLMLSRSVDMKLKYY